MRQNDHVRATLRTGQRQRVLLPPELTVEGVLAEFKPREVLVEPVIYKSIPIGVIILATGDAFDEKALHRLELLRPGLASGSEQQLGP